MADFVIEALGDWGKQIEIPLERAMLAGMHQFGRSTQAVTRQMLGFLSSSAKNLTPIAPKERPVFANPFFRHLMRRRQYAKYRTDANRYRGYFRYAAWRYKQGSGPIFAYSNDEKKLAKIGRRGLAQKSWRWGMASIGIPGPDPIEGTHELYELRATISGASVVGGYRKINKLSYVPKIMPSGWRRSAEQSAINRTMGMVRESLRRDVATAMVNGWHT